MPGTISPLQQIFVVGTVIPITETQRGHAVASGHTAQMAALGLEATVLWLQCSLSPGYAVL